MEAVCEEKEEAKKVTKKEVEEAAEVAKEEVEMEVRGGS